MTRQQEVLIEDIYHHNDMTYNLHKAAEEFQELALVLTQLALKPLKVTDEMVIDEIGDCKIRMAILERMFSKTKIQERVNKKLLKFEGYLLENKYKGI